MTVRQEFDGSYVVNAVNTPGTQSGIRTVAASGGGLGGASSQGWVVIDGRGGGTSPGNFGTGTNVQQNVQNQITTKHFGNGILGKFQIHSSDEKQVLTLDLPGVMPESLGVQYGQGLISVIGERFDTGAKFNYVHPCDRKYDPYTASVKLEYGLLIITMLADERFNVITKFSVNCVRHDSDD